MRKHVVAIMSILLASTVAATASAEPDRPDVNIERMASRLGLDDTQKQAIENIHLAAQPEFEALQEKIKENHEARKALADRVRSEVEAVLTDEQRSQLEEERANRDEQRKHRPGMGKRDNKNADRPQIN